jgi:4-alpha-glucanotransferase
MQKLDVPQRRAGTVVAVSSLWSKESGGTGEFLDLIPFGELCKASGLSLIQILPINDSGAHSSPYFALSAFALHPLYLRIKALPEFAKVQEAAQWVLDSLPSDQGQPLNYRSILTGKLSVLRRIYNECSESIRKDKDLSRWIKDNRWIKDYAVFKILKEENEDKGWQDWGSHKSPSPADIDSIWKDGKRQGQILFHAWLQFRLEEQLLTVSAALDQLGVGLKGDLPILLNQDSADVWAHRDIFDLSATAGAPPDAEAPLGQNWSFPLYNWDALQKRNYDFWVDRLRQAGKFYKAYRIDHVLGFFRIWAVPEKDYSAALGHFEPSMAIDSSLFSALGFDQGRMRWLSLPHVKECDLAAATAGAADPLAEKATVISLALNRINSEPLFLFKPQILGEKTIYDLPVCQAAKDFLARAWRDRALVKDSTGGYRATWSYGDSTAYKSLSPEERRGFDRLISENTEKNEKIWENQGRQLLSALCEATEMLVCAEDLGAIPPSVPRVLNELGVLGLRVARWTRRWQDSGQPFVPLSEYPENSVATLSVHDSSSLREWWESEPGSRCAFYYSLGLSGDCPSEYSPEVAKLVLSRMSLAASKLYLPTFVDLLAVKNAYRKQNPKDERINVPGTVSDGNWSYRIPARVEEILMDSNFQRSIKEIIGERG